MDSIEIRSIHCSVQIGVSEQEREASQPVDIDLTLALDLSRAGREDELSATVDYGEVVRQVKQLAESGEWRLVEALAEAVAGRVLKFSLVEEVKVLVRKYPVVLRQEIEYAAVCLTRR